MNIKILKNGGNRGSPYAYQTKALRPNQTHLLLSLEMDKNIGNFSYAKIKYFDYL